METKRHGVGHWDARGRRLRFNKDSASSCTRKGGNNSSRGAHGIRECGRCSTCPPGRLRDPHGQAGGAERSRRGSSKPCREGPSTRINIDQLKVPPQDRRLEHNQFRHMLSKLGAFPDTEVARLLRLKNSNPANAIAIRFGLKVFALMGEVNPKMRVMKTGVRLFPIQF